MFAKSEAETKLDAEIERAFHVLSNEDPDSDEYGSIIDRVAKLTKLKEEVTSRRRVSPDTLAMIAANLIGIALIIRHEHANVITSKALGFVQKPK